MRFDKTCLREQMKQMPSGNLLLASLVCML